MISRKQNLVGPLAFILGDALVGFHASKRPLLPVLVGKGDTLQSTDLQFQQSVDILAISGREL